jgi:hypothetical protein
VLGGRQSDTRVMPQSIISRSVEGLILAKRGGLSPYELLAVMFDQPFWRCALPEPTIVIKKQKEKLAEFEC